MSDIGIFVVNNCFQLVLEDGDLKEDPTLETAVSISLFTDQRASETELSDGLEQKRGWWGDLFPQIEGDQIGSKLWLLDRGKVQLETLAGLENFSNLALQWMIDDGVATSVSATAEYDDQNQAIISVGITRPQGQEPDRFSINWDQQEILRA